MVQAFEFGPQSRSADALTAVIARIESARISVFVMCLPLDATRPLSKLGQAGRPSQEKGATPAVPPATDAVRRKAKVRHRR